MKLAIALYLAMLFVPAPGSDRGRYDPMATKSHHQHSDFLGWLFSRQSPHGTDYGAKIEERRQEVIGTFESQWFWLTATGWMWVAILFVRVCHHERVREQRLTITARMFARIYNSYVDARHKALAAINMHNALVASTNLAPLAADTKKPERSQRESDGNQRSLSTATAAKKTAPEHQATGADYVAQINALQEQLTASQDTLKKKQEEIERYREQIKKYEHEIPSLRSEIARLNGRDRNFAQGNS